MRSSAYSKPGKGTPDTRKSLNWKLTPGWKGHKTEASISEINIEKRRGDNTLPSLKPVFTLNSSVTPPSKRNTKVFCSNRACNAKPNRELTPKLANFENNNDLSTEGKADLKSISAANKTHFF
jgi:hypothetical protein